MCVSNWIRWDAKDILRWLLKLFRSRFPSHSHKRLSNWMFDPIRYRQLITISTGVSPFALWSICVFFSFSFQLASHQSTQQNMFFQRSIRIYLNRKLSRNWLINMKTQTFQRDQTFKASLLAVWLSLQMEHLKIGCVELVYAGQHFKAGMSLWSYWCLWICLFTERVYKDLTTSYTERIFKANCET